jgi:hypothetical protein
VVFVDSHASWDMRFTISPWEPTSPGIVSLTHKGRYLSLEKAERDNVLFLKRKGYGSIEKKWTSLSLGGPPRELSPL